DHPAAVVVRASVGRGNVGGVIAGALDRGVLRDGLLGDARRYVDAELEPVPVHVIGDRLDPVRELRGVDGPASILVDGRSLAARAGVPEVVDVHVLESGLAEPAALHGVGLRLDDGRGGVTPDEAPTAPAEEWLLANPVVLRLGRARPRQSGHRKGEE